MPRRSGGYSENSPASAQSATALPVVAIRERYRCRIALLSPRDRTPGPSACNSAPGARLPEAVCGFRRPGQKGLVPLTATTRRHGQAKQEVDVFPPPSAASSARQHLILPAVCGDFYGQVLHRWRRDTDHQSRSGRRQCAPLSTMASSGTCCTAVMAYVPSSFSRILTQRNRRAGATSATSAPTRCILQRAVRNTAHFYLHAVGDGLDLHADRIGHFRQTRLISASVVPEDGSSASFCRASASGSGCSPPARARRCWIPA